jgi:DNA-binding beta-propeller fold protein YncE
VVLRSHHSTSLENFNRVKLEPESAHCLIRQRGDKGNNRLVVFDSPLANTVTNQVIGQPDFFSNTAATTASGLAGPKGLAVDRAGNLYVTDEDNNRVLPFDRSE